jgi:hypothetical protein
VLLLGCAVLHLESLGRGFFADDYLFLEQVRGRSLWAALASPDPLGNYLRPLGRQVYFWVLARAGHETPLLFHVVNLCLFLVSAVVLFRLVRLIGGNSATAVSATAIFAFHYAADVPVEWVSGAQDLLAVLFASSAIHAHVRGSRVLSVLLIAAALLSKEAVGLVSIVAIVASQAPGRSWFKGIRDAGWMLGLTAAWAVWWTTVAATSRLKGTLHAVRPMDFAAAFVHFAQSALGLEFREGGGAIGHWKLSALLLGALAAGAVWLAGSTSSRPGAPEGIDADPRRLLQTGVAWSVAGVLPTVLVVGIWSAYFYLFAMAGAAIVLSAALLQLPRAFRPVIVGALVCCSANARLLDEFSGVSGAWAWQSHVNRHYLDRATSSIQGYLMDLRSARPRLPHRSTVFFADVPVSLGWQTADGPVLRWAYRDSSLRSYYLTQFSEDKAGRGPLYFFAVESGHLVDKSGSSDLLPALAYSMLAADKPVAAVSALNVALKDSSANRELFYWRALAILDIGDTSRAVRDLIAAGIRPARFRSLTDTSSIRSSFTDTLARYNALVRLRSNAGLEPWVHRRLAALCLVMNERQHEGVIEAYAFRVLSPQDPDAWRKWGAAQLAARQYVPALHSLERYVALARGAGQSDTEAQAVIESLRRVVRGDIAHAALRNRAPGEAPVP